MTSDHYKRITDLESRQTIAGAGPVRPAGFGPRAADKRLHCTITVPPRSWRAFEAE